MDEIHDFGTAAMKMLHYGRSPWSSDAFQYTLNCSSRVKIQFFQF
uniref:Uncharacterized protein n=1 Tax=Anguilla anguilla TaxID=7936 RepID=A0A0E9RSZ4_ANGAN